MRTSLEQATAERALFPHMERSIREMAAPLDKGDVFPLVSASLWVEGSVRAKGREIHKLIL